MSGGGGGGGGGSNRDDFPPPVKPNPPAQPDPPTDGDPTEGGGSNPCDLVEITYINSPVANVVSTLSVGDTLALDVSSVGRRVLVRTAASSIAGSITAPFLAQLLLCLDAGYIYEAEILKIQGGVYKIEVRRV